MKKPTVIKLLPGGVYLRTPWPSELAFFRKHIDIAGMASDDNAVVLNPYSPLSDTEKKAVALNEAARVVMATTISLQPKFRLTKAQKERFKNYGSVTCIKATVAARLVSGDPSALTPTHQQKLFVERLARSMGLRGPMAQKGRCVTAVTK